MQREAIVQRHMFKLRARGCTDVDLRARSLRQLAMARDEVGVQVRLKNVADLQAMFAGRFQVEIDIALGIYHCGFAIGAQHVRSVGQTSQIKLLKIHRYCLPGAFAGRTSKS